MDQLNQNQLSLFAEQPEEQPYRATVNQVLNEQIYGDPQFADYFVFQCYGEGKQVQLLHQASRDFATWTDCLESYTYDRQSVYLLCRTEQKDTLEQKLQQWKREQDLGFRLNSCRTAGEVPDHVMLNLLLNRLVGTNRLRGEVYRYLVSDSFRMVRTESPWMTKKQIHAIRLRFQADGTLHAYTDTYTRRKDVSDQIAAKYPNGYLATDSTVPPFQFLVTVPTDSVSVDSHRYVKKQIFPGKATRLYWTDLRLNQSGDPAKAPVITKFEHFVVPAVQVFEQEYDYPLQFRTLAIQTRNPEEPAWSWERIVSENPLDVMVEDLTGDHTEMVQEVQHGLRQFEPYGIRVVPKSSHRLTLIHDKEYYQRDDVGEPDPYRSEGNCQHLTVETWEEHRSRSNPHRKKDPESPLLNQAGKDQVVISREQRNILQVCLLSLILQDNLVRGKLNLFPWLEEQDWVVGAHLPVTRTEDSGDQEPELGNTYLVLHPDCTVELGTEPSDFVDPVPVYTVGAALSAYPDAAIVLQRGKDMNIVEDSGLCFLPYGFLQLPLVGKTKKHPATRTTGQDALEQYCKELINTVVIPTDDPAVWLYAVNPLSGNGSNPTNDFGHYRTWLRKVTCVNGSEPFVLDHPELFRAVFVSLSRKYTAYPFLLALLRTYISHI